MPINRYVDLSGGQNNQVNQFIVQDNESSLIKNGSLDIIGAIQKDLGYTQLGDTVASSDILGMIEYRKSTDGTNTPILANGTTIKKLVTGVWTNIETGLTGDKFEFEVFMDSLFAVNGGNDNRVWNGTTWTSSNDSGEKFFNTPACRLVKKWHESMFISGNSTKKSKVWFSDKPQGTKLPWGWETGTDLACTAGSPVVTSASASFKVVNIKPGDTLRITSTTNFGDYVVRTIDSATQLTLATNIVTTATGLSYEAGSNWFEVGQDDGDAVTGFGDNSDRLIIFKNFSAHRWDGASIMKIGDFGTPTQRTVVNIKRWTLFSNRTGIFAYDGVEPQLVSKKLQKYFKAIPEANLAKMVAWSEDDLYRVFIGDVTVDEKTITNCVINYDISQNSLTTSSLGHVIRAAAEYTDSTSVNQYVGSSLGKVYQLNSGTTYDGTPIDFEVITKQYDLDTPEDMKQVNKIVIFGDKLEGTYVSIQGDRNTMIPLAVLQGRDQSLNTRAQGRRFKLYFSHADISRPVIEGISFDWQKIENG